MSYKICGGRGVLPSQKSSPPHLFRLKRRELRRLEHIAVLKKSKIVRLFCKKNTWWNRKLIFALKRPAMFLSATVFLLSFCTEQNKFLKISNNGIPKNFFYATLSSTCNSNVLFKINLCKNCIFLLNWRNLQF